MEFVLNGKKVKAREFDVNLICDLEENGVSLLGSGINNIKMFPMLRAYVACCLYSDVQTAGMEIQNHMINGGSFDEISDCMAKAMDESDFFRQINKTTTQTTPKRASKKTESNTQA